VAHAHRDVLSEVGVLDPGLEVAPGVVDVHASLLQRRTPEAITAAIGTAI
jgi:hypothetical protein